MIDQFRPAAHRHVSRSKHRQVRLPSFFAVLNREEQFLIGAHQTSQELGIDRDDLNEQSDYYWARRELVLMGKVVSAGIDPETGMTMWRALPKGGDRCD